MNIPSVQDNMSLAHVSKKFKPDNVRITIALNSSPSLEACQSGVLAAVQRTRQFVENGHSDDNFDFPFKSIKHCM